MHVSWAADGCLESDVSQSALSLRGEDRTATCHFNTQTWLLKEDHRVLLSTVARRSCITAHELQVSISEKQDHFMADTSYRPGPRVLWD